MRHRAPTERGSASLETLFVVGFLLIPLAALLAQMPQWVGTSHATQIAANEAARAVALADTLTQGQTDAERVALSVITNHGHDPTDLQAVTIAGNFTRGGTVTVTVSLAGDPAVVPGFGSMGPVFTATRAASERIDDYRSFRP